MGVPDMPTLRRGQIPLAVPGGLALLMACSSGALAAALRDRGFDVATEQEAAMHGTSVRMIYARRR